MRSRGHGPGSQGVRETRSGTRDNSGEGQVIVELAKKEKGHDKSLMAHKWLKHEDRDSFSLGGWVLRKLDSVDQHRPN